MSGHREKHSFRLPADLVGELEAAARGRHASRTAIVEAALASYLANDGGDRFGAAVARRLDRLTRQVDRLAWHVDLANETLSLFIRFWLTTNPPLPDTATKAAQAMGKERWEGFVQSLMRRMERGPHLSREVGGDEEGRGRSDTDR
ncbi:MAG: ribbon-helix-helix protein, CopG family [Sphingomonas sp.]